MTLYLGHKDVDYEKPAEGACVSKLLMLLVYRASQTPDVARLHSYSSDIFQIQKHSSLKLLSKRLQVKGPLGRYLILVTLTFTKHTCCKCERPAVHDDLVMAWLIDFFFFSSPF